MDGPPLTNSAGWRRIRGEGHEQDAVAVLGIDLGKNSCSLAGLDASGAVVLRRRMTRERVIAFVSELPRVVAMEACCGAHFLGRLFQTQGHEVRLMSPEYVQPYVKAQKTNDRDAEGIAEAATRPTMRLVTHKSEAQLDHEEASPIADQAICLLQQGRLERNAVPHPGGDEMMKLVIADIASLGGDRLHALAVARPDQAGDVERIHPPPRWMR